MAPHIMNWIHGQVRAADRYPHGLFVGLSGIAWALADLGEVETASRMLARTENHRHLFRAADMFYGMAGFGMASLKMWQKTGTERHLQWAVRAGEWLLKTRQENEQGSFWPTPDGNTMIGYARGASGIALYLLYLYLVTRDERFRQTSREALRFDLSQGQKMGRYALSFPEEIDNTRILYPYWRRGSAGVGTSLVRYLAVREDEELAQYLEPISADCRRKYTVFPGLFDGLTGLGNFMLDCYQFTGNDRFLGEAHRAASGLMLFRTEREAGIAFPGDTLYRFSTDLGTGSAGIGLFLHRLLTGGANFNFVLDELLPQGARIQLPAPIS
jgi:lantibiotic modifying enzyme